MEYLFVYSVYLFICLFIIHPFSYQSSMLSIHSQISHAIYKFYTLLIYSYFYVICLIFSSMYLMFYSSIYLPINLSQLFKQNDLSPSCNPFPDEALILPWRSTFQGLC